MKKVFNFLFIFLWCLGFCASSVFAVDPSNKRKKWSPDEDEKLRAGVSQLGENSWKRVSEEFVCTRSPRQCRERWRYYLSTNEDTPWDYYSDDLLLELYEKYGPKWEFIAQFIPDKSEMNIKNRYHYLTYKHHRERELADKSWTDLETRPSDYRYAVSYALNEFEFELEVSDFEDDRNITVIPEELISISCDPLPSIF